MGLGLVLLAWRLLAYLRLLAGLDLSLADQQAFVSQAGRLAVSILASQAERQESSAKELRL